MPRVKRGVTAHKRHKKILARAQGMSGARGDLFKVSNEAVMHSLAYQYRDRRVRKRDMRALWIARINAAARQNGMTYNRFIQGLKAAGVEVDRKNLADIAISDPAAFTALVDVARAALPDDVNAPSGEAA